MNEPLRKEDLEGVLNTIGTSNAGMAAVDEARRALDQLVSLFPRDLSATSTPIAQRVYKAIKQLEDAYRAASLRSVTDPLTGGLNKSGLIEYGPAWVEKIAEINTLSNGKLTGLVLAADVDHFKQINDTHGHAVGDTALRVIGESLRRILRKSDSYEAVARAGGDEFVVLLSAVPVGQEEPAMAAVTERAHNEIYRAARRDPVLSTLYGGTKKNPFEDNLSIGHAVYGKDGTDFDTLYQAADKSLYDVKRARRTARE